MMIPWVRASNFSRGNRDGGAPLVVFAVLGAQRTNDCPPNLFGKELVRQFLPFERLVTMKPRFTGGGGNEPPLLQAVAPSNSQ